MLSESKDLLQSLADFQDYVQETYPEFETTRLLDELRAIDYHRLDLQDHTYLDFTGGNLYGQSQINKHHELLSNQILGNPHSLNPSSKLAASLVEESRDRIREFFNAQEYFLVFTPNASGALKIIGESYPFDFDSHFLLPFDNHNSVNGIREYAKSKGAGYSYSPITDELHFDVGALRKNLSNYPDKTHKLFAYPAQSNVSGVKHSLNWVQEAQKQGWDVLLDASAFVPTNQLDLQEVQPEFVSMSFYKMFGYPTGLGALFIQKDVFPKLSKPWFAGGTVTLASAMTDHYYLMEDHSKFEDGTINYLDIPALHIGIDHLDSIGMDLINKRITVLTQILLDCLQKLRHANGAPIVRIFGPLNVRDRGGTLIFNFLTPEGTVYPYMNVEQEANKRNISLRTGCFCNPGIDEINSHLMSGELEQYFSTQSSLDVRDMINQLDKMRGAVRVSVGMITNTRDLYRFLTFVSDFMK